MIESDAVIIIRILEMAIETCLSVVSCALIIVSTYFTSAFIVVSEELATVDLFEPLCRHRVGCVML